MNLDDLNVDIAGNIETQEFSLNMGPQHPSTHGVYRAVLTIDGEQIKSVENKIGYLHRGMEKLAETRTYTQFIPYTDRLDYVSGMLNNMAYVTAVEKLAGIEVPDRAEYIRVIMAELQRIASHLVYIGSFSIDLNAVSGWMYAFTLREKVLDLLEMVSGSRMTVSYMRIGGVADDLPEGFEKSITDFLVEARERINELEGFVAKNEIFVARTRNIGILDPETAVKYGVTGPNLRAAGVNYDLRKNAPYSVYGKLDFEVPVMKTGDCHDRFMIRFLEIKQSLRIIEQAFATLPEGPVTSKVPRVLKPAKGEVYSHIESSKGLLGFYIVSDGSTKPYRLHIHSPSFVNIGIIPVLAKGLSIQDFISVLASIDFILGEVDR